jgi:voltage-gated potassium channel Kch
VPAGSSASPARSGPPPPRLPRAHARFQRRAARAIADRHVFRYLAGAIVVLSLLSGTFAWLTDRKDFHTLGDGLWWAVVTLATVGYGDIVPHTAWGRVVGSVVIVCGVTFLSILTATITSYFVSGTQEERAVEAAEVEAQRGQDAQDTRAVLDEIRDRLRAIEEHLDRERD